MGARDPDRVAVTVDDEAGLAVLAGALAASLPDRAFVALEGDLGAGKTTFVKALASAAGIDAAEVTSPTFGLIHVHDLPPAHPAGRLVHADLYRLSGAGELGELGWDEILAAPGWVAAEWPSRAPRALPPDRLDVAITILSETGRRFDCRASGARHAAAVSALARLAGASVG